MEQSLTLPRLREDLNLFEGPRLRDGSPTWTLHDPLRNLYFRIGWLEFELLSRFRLGSGEAILQETERLGLAAATEQKLQQLIQFLMQNELTTRSEPQRHGKGKQHSLLFFKVPLFHPDHWLEWGASRFSLFFSPLFFWGVITLGIGSLWMLLQQWEQFWSTFTDFQTPLGVAAFAAAILFSKVVHELGHGLTAKHFGLRVPSFGIAFMFLWPVFYTDTSDAWRLRSRKQRLLIGAAGVMAETLLAIIASLCWLWLPDGLPKAVAFTVAATTWGITLLVNLNPFMRFDGYFLLSDGWDIPNLQSRAFELGKRYLQSLVMGSQKPEPLTGESRTQNRWLISYAWMTWLYRLSLYIGLALMAYHLLFKVLGIVLLVVEMSVLVVKPVVLELQRYWSEKSAFRWVGSNRLLLLMLFISIALLITPWRGEVVAPAVWKQASQQGIYSPDKGRVVSIDVVEGESIEEGQQLAMLVMPELEYQQEMLMMQIAEQRSILQSAGMDEQGRESVHIEQQKLESLLAQLRQVDEKLGKAEVVAAFSGIVSKVNRDIREGEWVEAEELLFVVADPQNPSLIGYFHERELGRLQLGVAARFLPENRVNDLPEATLSEVAASNSHYLEEPLLASLYRGSLPVREGAEGELVLQDSFYRVRFEMERQPEWLVGTQRGEVAVEVEATTYLQRGWELLQQILIQESGF